MTPDTLRIIIDLVTILVGVYAIVLAVRSNIGGLFGRAMRFILAGLFILTINHALDSIYLANVLREAGHARDFLQAPNVLLH